MNRSVLKSLRQSQRGLPWAALSRPGRRTAPFGRASRRAALRETRVKEIERMRLARDLHDELGHRILAVILEVDRLASRYGSMRHLEDDLASVRRHLVETADALHDVAVTLSPRCLADHGLTSALAALVSRSEATSGVRITFTSAGDTDRLPPEVALAAFRIAQEAITNALKYAEATAIAVSAAVDRDQLALEITDDGQGFDLPQAGDGARPQLGLRGMHDRALSLGGRLEIETGAGRGTVVRVWLPAKR